MTPHEFVAKWHNTKVKESAAAQSHFNDLCELLDEPKPMDQGSDSNDYAFEFGATKSTGGQGFADVFKRDHFGWEYKGTGANLDTALDQLRRYEIALARPPLLIVSDMGTTIRVHTNWTNSVSATHEIAIPELEDAASRTILKNVFADPEALRPAKTRQQLTEQIAAEFAELTASLRGRGHGPQEVAHFVNRLVFCMFAEDVGLLPNHIFTKMLERAKDDPDEFPSFARDLFGAMHRKGGRVGFEKIDWFNGGLFDDDTAFALTREEIGQVHKTALEYWGDVDPAILGTLFERGLDPSKRSQLGAHYTDRAKIEQIVRPTVLAPLEAKWAAAKAIIVGEMEKAESAKTKGARTNARNRASDALTAFLERLKAFRVLDPACGSGNFLYVALKALKDLEHRARVEAEALGLPRGVPEIGPEVVRGIEINPYAAELARVSVWIGEIQWMLKNGFGASRDPILKPLGNIECRDALLRVEQQDDGTEVVVEAEWPRADVIVGNPPFAGAKQMKRKVGGEETRRIRVVFEDRLPAVDFVGYWFEKARAAILAGRSTRVGFVATKSIAKNTNLPVMRRIDDDLTIFEAYANQPWVIDGAAVRVALVCFGAADHVPTPFLLEGERVETINPDLTSGIDYSSAPRLPENRGRSVLGIQKSGPFDVDGDLARRWLAMPTNPNGRSNVDVLKPYLNGDELTGRSGDRWFIDLPRGLTEEEASLWEAPFEYLRTALYDQSDPTSQLLRDERQGARDRHARERWWEPYWPRPDMRERIEAIPRYLVTPETAEHRPFAWLAYPVLPDKNLVVVPRDDNTTFGILQSRFHEAWARAIGNRMGAGNQSRYNNLTCFETFPFPDGLTPDRPATDYSEDPRAVAIAEAAAKLDQYRKNWLNPPELVRREPEVVEGFPDRLLPIDDAAARELKKRTLTNLYNARPAWLANAHAALDRAVALAYGWPEDIADDEALARLFSLNQQRASAAT